MMVVGQLDDNSSLPDQPPVVRATKVQDLSSDGVLQTLWPIEVQDMRLCVR